jgi:hypothetical protein
MRKIKYADRPTEEPAAGKLSMVTDYLAYYREAVR